MRTIGVMKSPHPHTVLRRDGENWTGLPPWTGFASTGPRRCSAMSTVVLLPDGSLMTGQSSEFTKTTGTLY